MSLKIKLKVTGDSNAQGIAFANLLESNIVAFPQEISVTVGHLVDDDGEVDSSQYVVTYDVE